MSGWQFFFFFPTLSWWMFASRALVITDQTQKGEGDSATRNWKWKEGMTDFYFFFLFQRKDFTQQWGTPKGSKKKWYWVLDEQCVRTGRKKSKENLWLLWKFHPISKIKDLRTTQVKIPFTTVFFFHTRAQQSCIQEPLQVVHLLGFNCYVPKG